MITIRRLFFSLFFFVAASNVVVSDLFKIAVPRFTDGAVGLTPRHFRQAKGACSDSVTVSNPESLHFSLEFQDLKRPWVDIPRATAMASATATQGINHLFSLKVPGLNANIGFVIEYLQESGCLSFPFGGCVRDQFLGAIPADLDMESNCDTNKLLNECLKMWPNTSCWGKGIVHFGNPNIMPRETDVIDAANWEETFFGDGTALEYTTNSIAYFSGGLNILIDLTGQGINDTCNKIIRITVANDAWEKWVSSPPGKIYRFWKLRVKGYTAVDNATLSFVVNKAKQLIMQDPKNFTKFYCITVLNGKYENSHCSIKISDCSKVMTRKAKYDTYFESDFGTFWDDTVKPKIDGLECSICSGLQTCSDGGSSATFLVLAIVGPIFMILECIFCIVCICAYIIYKYKN